MDLHSTYLSIEDLRRKAKRRLPHFVWEYLDSGTGAETARARERAAFDRVTLLPRALRGEPAPDLTMSLLGRSYALPFGIAPVGMSGLIWPDAEACLARHAKEAQLPYCMSTVAAARPEDVGPKGENGWYQLYPPRDVEIRRDMLTRVKDSGFDVLVLTVDVPVASRRERLVRSGMASPPRLSPRIAWQCAQRPAWSLARLRHGMPRMETLDPYVKNLASRDPTAHVGYLLRTAPDMAYLRWLREHWQGVLVVKGVLCPEDASAIEAAGADAIWVSSHAGRQFDGAPPALRMLPRIRAATGLPIIFDSGIEGALDMLRAYALGADFVMLGRAWHYAIAALGPRKGPAHLAEILRRDLVANMGQLGITRTVEACLYEAS